MAYLSACDAFVGAADDCVLALGTAEALDDQALYEGAIECVDVDVYLIAQRRESEMDYHLGGILMLGPAGVSEQAASLRADVTVARKELGYLTNALIPGASPPPELEPLDDWWSKVERSKDQVLASRSAFIAIAHGTLTSLQAWS
ncbi:hypothetical protein ACWFR5_26735 [Streptomyces sp. NPDC055092]